MRMACFLLYVETSKKRAESKREIIRDWEEGWGEGRGRDG
jgi:hypothetical protein